MSVPRRIAPLEAPYPDEIADTLRRMMGGSSAEPLELFRVVAHNAHILDKFRSTGSYLLNFGTIDPVERELVILRTCARCYSEYEWGVHVALFGERVGLSRAEIDATVTASWTDPAWSPRRSALIRLVDELHDTSEVSDELWEELARHFEPAQLIELVALVGQYHMVSFFTNAFRIPPEKFGAPLPRALPVR